MAADAAVMLVDAVAGVEVADELRAFADAECDVVVDFTVADAARVSLPWLAMHGIHAVVGTTGFSDDDLAMIRSSFGDGPAHCLIAPNFAISAVLMMRFAEMAAPHFRAAEIIELHHDEKVDAPSATASAPPEFEVRLSGDKLSMRVTMPDPHRSLEGAAARLALELPGWSGMFLWRHQHPGYDGLEQVKVDRLA